MKKDKRKNMIITVLMALIIFITSTLVVEPVEASAGSKYIRVDAFIKYLVTEMKYTVDKSSKQPYIDAALKNGILKKGDFKDYSTYLTRTDCAVIANQLDEKINFKYNYSYDIYEILSDCNYFEGKLYYNTNGKLYPEGATKDTYPAAQFLEEVLSPVLEVAFQYDDWASKGLRAGYEYMYDDNNNFTERYIVFGVKPESEYNAVGIDSFNDTSYIVQAWNTIHDGDRKVAAVLEKRISDISKIAKSKRVAVAAIVAKGIMTGSSNGMFVHNRSFKGSDKITAAGAKGVIQKVLYPEKRSLVSPDGQLIRTTNLPKNAVEYSYILECFPNYYYEVRYNFMFYTDFKSGKTDKSLYAYPRETAYEFLYDKFYKNKMNASMDRYEYYDTALAQAEKYLNCVFNMNYKTVNKQWVKNLATSFAEYRDPAIESNISDYINAVKENHVIVENKLITIDPGSMYYSNSSLYVRAYVKYRITADNIDVNQDLLLYGVYNNLIGLKNGEWRDGYYDIRISPCDDYEKSNHIYWGVDALVRISDAAYRGTY